MNEELFKRLQDQCWVYNTHPDMIDTDSNGDARPCGFDAKKFAELIVRECVEICHKLAKLSDSYVVHDGDTCATQIKKHFGVEE